MIIALLLIPILGVLFLLPSEATKLGKEKMKQIALFFSLINFLISIIM
jgi:hypothetical protein